MNNIQNNGALIIAEAIILNKSLIKILINKNNIEEEVFKFLSEAIPQNTTLLELDVCNF